MAGTHPAHGAIRFALGRQHRGLVDEPGAGRHGLLHHPGVQPIARDAEPLHARAVLAAHAHAAGPGEEHAVDDAALPPERREIEVPGQQRQRAGVQRVAAQLLAREARAIDERDARAAPREQARGQRARRSRARNHHVIGRRHEVASAAPSTRAQFFEPNPRQLQSAASACDRAALRWG